MKCAAVAFVVVALGSTGAVAQSIYEGQLISLPAPFGYVEPNGWDRGGITADGEVAYLMRPSHQRGRVWVRYEYAAPYEGVRSSRSLMELDCGDWRTRTLEYAEFSAPNFGGPPSAMGGPTQWRFAAPGSVAETVLEFGCGD